MSCATTDALLPVEIAEALFSCIKTFTHKDEHGTLPSEKSVSDSMDRAFNLLTQVKKMPRTLKVQAVWRLSELGTFPLIVLAMVPGSATFSLACTLLGIALEDEDLLSHKIGKTLTRDEKFLSSVAIGIEESVPGTQGALLVCQMLNNVMKTASSTMIAQLCHFGDVVKTFATCMRQASEKLDEMDWRHPFVVADMLLFMEMVPECHEKLDASLVGRHCLSLFTALGRNDTVVSDILYAKIHLLHRISVIVLLWLGRQSIISTVDRAAITSAVVNADKHEALCAAATKTHPSLGNIVSAIGNLANDDFEKFEACKGAVEERLKDWELIEQSAMAKVRSDEFKDQVTSERGRATEQLLRERYKLALREKETGNEAFKGKKYNDAVTHYRSATAALEADFQGILEAHEVDVLLAKLFNNMAECHLKMADFKAAVDSATDGIDANPAEVKGWFRRAKGYIGLGSISNALSDIHRVLGIEPDNIAAQEVLAQLASSVK